MRQLPQVDKLLRHPRLVELQRIFRRDLMADLIREELSLLRDRGDDRQTGEEMDLDGWAHLVALKVESLCRQGLRRVINGTGIVLHTNLGRAPLSPAAVDELSALAGGYVNLEIDLLTGERGKRSEHLSSLLRLITGAEAAICVNNNAAAVILCVSTFAAGKEVIVSRGELIEIGGSFRLPDVITAGGARLREVGTTNRTRAADYESAVGANSGLIMRCHRSNFDISGFTEQPSLGEIIAIGNTKQVPVLEDLGSGVLCDIEALTAFRGEPTVREVVASGCDLVSFSGDKLLAGPQAGIIVGKKTLIERLSKNALYRALRLDKVTMRLLESTLRTYLSPDPEHRLPALTMLGESADSVRRRAEAFAHTLVSARSSKNLSAAVVACRSAAGGGSLPGQEIPSFGLQIAVAGMKTAQLAQTLRQSAIPVVGVIKDGNFVLDFRTICEGDLENLSRSLLALQNQ